METAYFLITLARQTPAEVARAIRRIPGITEAVVTMGDVDIIALGHLDGTKGFAGLSDQLRHIDGVAKVATYVVIRP
ncbi:MAG: Lrp/AsnC ligand binding domain-containing protein [bacterium]